MKTTVSRIEKAGCKLIGTHSPGSEEWHAQRANAIGGSDIAPIMNRSPWTSQYFLWAQKSGKLLAPASTMAMKLGNYFEPAIIKLFSDLHPHLKISDSSWTFASDLNSAFHANPDAIIEDEDGRLSILEIKFSRNPMPDLPEHYRLQVAWYQMVTGLHNPAVLCAVAGGEYREFVIEYDERLATEMKEAAQGFLELLLTDTEPTIEGSKSTYETIRQLHLEILDEEVEIDPEEFEKLQSALDQEGFWKQQVTLRKSIIQNSMKGAKWGYVDGVNVVMLQSRGEGKPFLKILER